MRILVLFILNASYICVLIGCNTANVWSWRKRIAESLKWTVRKSRIAEMSLYNPMCSLRFPGWSNESGLCGNPRLVKMVIALISIRTHRTSVVLSCVSTQGYRTEQTLPCEVAGFSTGSFTIDSRTLLDFPAAAKTYNDDDDEDDVWPSFLSVSH